MTGVDDSEEWHDIQNIVCEVFGLNADSRLVLSVVDAEGDEILMYVQCDICCCTVIETFRRGSSVGWSIFLKCVHFVWTTRSISINIHRINGKRVSMLRL
jgi:hypothetical protein